MTDLARLVSWKKIEDGAVPSHHIDRMTDDGLIFVDGQTEPSWAVVYDREGRARDVRPVGEMKVGLMVGTAKLFLRLPYRGHYMTSAGLTVYTCERLDPDAVKAGDTVGIGEVQVHVRTVERDGLSRIVGIVRES